MVALNGEDDPDLDAHPRVHPTLQSQLERAFSRSHDHPNWYIGWERHFSRSAYCWDNLSLFVRDGVPHKVVPFPEVLRPHSPILEKFLCETLKEIAPRGCHLSLETIACMYHKKEWDGGKLQQVVRDTEDPVRKVIDFLRIGREQDCAGAPSCIADDLERCFSELVEAGPSGPVLPPAETYQFPQQKVARRLLNVVLPKIELLRDWEIEWDIFQPRSCMRLAWNQCLCGRGPWCGSPSSQYMHHLLTMLLHCRVYLLDAGGHHASQPSLRFLYKKFSPPEGDASDPLFFRPVLRNFRKQFNEIVKEFFDAADKACAEGGKPQMSRLERRTNLERTNDVLQRWKETAEASGAGWTLCYPETPIQDCRHWLFRAWTMVEEFEATNLCDRWSTFWFRDAIRGILELRTLERRHGTFEVTP